MVTPSEPSADWRKAITEKDKHEMPAAMNPDLDRGGSFYLMKKADRSPIRLDPVRIRRIEASNNICERRSRGQAAVLLVPQSGAGPHDQKVIHMQPKIP
jgi:hypothetical protein